MEMEEEGEGKDEEELHVPACEPSQHVSGC